MYLHDFNSIRPATGATSAEADISPFYDHLKTTQDICRAPADRKSTRLNSSH